MGWVVVEADQRVTDAEILLYHSSYEGDGVSLNRGPPERLFRIGVWRLCLDVRSGDRVDQTKDPLS